ncbi:MAG: hypothetical protein M1822_009584 [Bathelium mastoideum]|nr:MAG: hypothetical protein M1822_009584 [Bathelium mastoideum]
MEMLDEEHERLPQASTDHNVYNLGNITGHNVVIVGLYSSGNNATATVVSQMRMTFPNLRFGMLVGISGGVPVKTDNGMIRLGDIIVSKPVGEHFGAVQYDHGKARSGQFERIGAFAPPPTVLLNAAQDLAAKQARSRIDPIKTNLKRIDTNIRGLRKYKYPGIANDHLYHANYIHLKPELSCIECGCHPSQRIPRPTDKSDDDDEPSVVVHRGMIASGELVIKDAELRDKLAKAYGLLCFKMEAAGALTDFPCIIIRGISDYCDSHKNNRWHGFAAVAAAAYARQLFFYMPIDEVKRSISQTAENNIYQIKSRHEEESLQKILEWLSPTKFSAEQHDIISRKQDGTAQWFLDAPKFKNWLQGPNRTLFCPGIPGAGKTMIAAVTIDYLSSAALGNSVGISYLFCSYKAQFDQSAYNLLAALLKQLLQARPDLAAAVDELHNRHSKLGTKPSLDELMQALGKLCLSYSTTYMVIDALDECSNTNSGRSHLIQKLRELQAGGNVRLLFTSRFIPEVTEWFQSDLRLEVRASEEDVRRFVAGQISRLPNCIQCSEELKNDVQNKIIESVNGMWVLLGDLTSATRSCLQHLGFYWRVFTSILSSIKQQKKKVRVALAKLQKGSTAIDRAYKDALYRIDGQLPGHRELARRALAWITYAQRLLTTDELRHALAIELGESTLDHENLDDIDQVVSVCSGLVAVDKESNIIRLTHYTTQEYFEKVRSGWNPDAQEEIAAACLTYLSFNTFTNGSSASDEAFEQRLAENPFFNYSAHHWGRHLQPVQHSCHASELALALLCNDALVDSVIQVVSVSTYRYSNYSLRFPRQSNGLHLAARYGLSYIIQMILEQESRSSINIDAKDGYGRTPLSWAAGGGHEAVVRQLLATEKVDVDAKDTTDGQTPLSWAAGGGHEAVVRQLLATEKVDVDAKDTTDGRTPLSQAAEGGHEAVVRQLLATEKVDVDAKDTTDGQTPLWLAAEGGHEAVVQQLLATEKVDVDAKDEDGRTPLSQAARRGHEAVVRQLLATEKVDVDAKDTTDGRTPLSQAAEGGHEAVVQQLLATEKVDVDAKDTTDGRTPLSWVAEGGHEAVVRQLLATEKVDVDAKDTTDGRTPLSGAAERGHEAVVQQLLATEKVDVDAKDRDGRTPLSQAAEGGHEAVVQLLQFVTSSPSAVSPHPPSHSPESLL